MMILEEIRNAFSASRNLIVLAAVIFAASLIIGFLFQPWLYGIFNPVVQQLSSDVRSGAITLSMEDIFVNNFFIVLKLFLFGLFIIFSPVLLAYNGFFIGYYIASTDNIFSTLLLTVPHGIFELPSCVIASAAGLVLTKFLIRFLKDLFAEEDVSSNQRIRGAWLNNSRFVRQSLILLAVALVLMFVAAVVEVYLTTSIAGWISSLFV